MNIKRGFSFVILTLVYAAAAAGGIVLYLALPFPFWAALLLADVAATVFVFLFSLLFSNASVYDPYWSVQPIVILMFAMIRGTRSPAAILLFAAVSVWGVRLTANWAYTFRGLAHQDWRYTKLKEQTGKFYPFVNFFGIHLVPTLVVYGCILPAVFVFAEAPAFHAGCIVFVVLSLLAVLLQGTADCQMHAFRKRGTGGLIRSGLWKYSRHPNYLGEILMWWGIGLAAVCLMPAKWWLLAGALANTALFLFVSIPLADGRQAAKQGYSEYAASTRMLLPIPKRKKSN